MFEKRAQVLHVRILRAHGLRNTQWFGTQDPYCKCWCSSTLDRDKKRTAVVTDGGEAAAWDEEFSFFPRKADREFLFFEVKNENNMKNASIGICRLPIKHIVESGDRVLLKTMVWAQSQLADKCKFPQMNNLVTAKLELSSGTTTNGAEAGGGGEGPSQPGPSSRRPSAGLPSGMAVE